MTDGGPLSASQSSDHDRAIRALKHHVAEMADLALGMVADGTRALLDDDQALSRSVSSRDTPLDRYDVEIEAEAMRTIAIHQPEGMDLRTVGAALKIANCVDRVGRLGYDIARYITQAPELADPAPEDLLRKMDARAREMVHQAVEAFVEGDATKAKAVFGMDDEVDALHRQVQSHLIQSLRGGGPSADRLAFYLLAARHLERVADNAGKIAEKAVYAITGERRPEYFPGLAHRIPTGAP